MSTFERLFDTRSQQDAESRRVPCCVWGVAISISLSLLVSMFYLMFVLHNVAQLYDLDRQRLVCYYSSPATKAAGTDDEQLRLLDVPGDLCTHINIGIAEIVNGTMVLSPQLQALLENDVPIYHAKNPNVQLLLWIGGADSGKQFAAMVANHTNRKTFIRSLKQILHKHNDLTGIDLDWEFPSAYNKERQHFSQLLYELRQAWHREQEQRHRRRKKHLLISVAVAASEGIALYAYDIRELNLYADYVNLMAYDYHVYSRATPFTGLNAPLFARHNEGSILSTVNINYSVSWWLKNGLQPHRLVVGLPTYGHSFTLVSPFNYAIGAPASAFGECGRLGFTTYGETCRCAARHLHTTRVYDNQTCSPYLSSYQDWISYEDPKSIACKTRYLKSLNIGGIMAFSLNADDIKNHCRSVNSALGKPIFPLIETIRSVLRN